MDAHTERAPTQAETELVLAQIETEKVGIAKSKAEILKIEAETRKADWDAESAKNLALLAQLGRETQERESKATLAGNDFHRVYLFNDSVHAESTKTAITRLTEWHRLYPGEPMEIIFTSGGGDAISGLALFDFLRYLSREGHHIPTGALGWAASMAGILLQAGDTRTMGKEAWLMIHEASFVVEGKTTEVETRVEWIKAVQERILEIFASRSTMSKAALRGKWKNKDWFISSDEALKLGLVDMIR